MAISFRQVINQIHPKKSSSSDLALNSHLKTLPFHTDKDLCLICIKIREQSLSILRGSHLTKESK